MNGVPQQLFSQPSGERHLRSGAQLGFVDANECHLAQYSEQRVVHHTWPDRQESLPCADAVSMMHNTQFIDHPVRFGVHQASMGWSADQSRVEVQSLRPPGEPPPGVSNMGASAPVQSTWAANQPWHRPVFTSDAGLATLQTIQGQTLLRPTVLPAVPHALENPISQQQEGVRVVAGAVPQPVNPPTNFRVLSGQKTPNQQIPAQHHTYQPLQQNVLPVVHRVVDNRSAQWIPAIPSQVPLTVDASQHTEAVVLPTAQMRAFHAPAHQVHYRDAPFGQLPVLLNPDNQACQPQGHARDAEPPPLPGGIWARKFHEQDPARCHAQPLPVLGQQPAHYGANITDAVPDSVVSHPAQPPSLLSHSLFDGLDAGLADNSPVVAKKDKPQKIAQDKPPPGLSLKPSPRKCRGSSAVTASECQDAENTKIVPAKDCSPPAAQSSLPLQIPVDEETAALDSCNEEQPEEYQPCTAAASSGTPPQRLKLNGTDSPEPVAYYSRCVDQAGHNASHPAQSQMNIEKAMSPRSPRNRSPNASTAPPRSRSVTPSSSDSSRDSSLHTIDDVQEQHSAQSPPATRNQNEQRQQHPSDDPDMSEDEVATTRSHTHQGDVSEVESGEIIDSRPVPGTSSSFKLSNPDAIHLVVLRSVTGLYSRPNLVSLSFPALRFHGSDPHKHFRQSGCMSCFNKCNDLETQQRIWAFVQSSLLLLQAPSTSVFKLRRPNSALELSLSAHLSNLCSPAPLQIRNLHPPPHNPTLSLWLLIHQQQLENRSCTIQTDQCRRHPSHWRLFKVTMLLLNPGRKTDKQLKLKPVLLILKLERC